MKKATIIILLTLTFSTLLHSQSVAFERYAPWSDLHVTFVQGYKVDSLGKVDITVLYADDTVTWKRLLEDLNATVMMTEEGILGTRLTLSDDPTQRTPLVEGECDLQVYDPKHMSVCIFHRPTRELYNRIFDNIVTTKINKIIATKP